MLIICLVVKKQFITTSVQHTINMYSVTNFIGNAKIVLSELGSYAGNLEMYIQYLKRYMKNKLK